MWTGYNSQALYLAEFETTEWESSNIYGAKILTNHITAVGKQLKLTHH